MTYREEIESLRRERDSYKDLAQCECGELPEYPAHGWMANKCPLCQAEDRAVDENTGGE